jgi:uncharacterized protein (TIGR03083 family)
MADELQALQASVENLRALVGRLSADDLTAQAYPTEWKVADVLSHLGSGAVVMRRRLEDSVTGAEMPADFAPSVWGAWNAKSPAEQAADVLVSDRAFLDYATSLSSEQRAQVRFSMGPMSFDFAGVIALRLNEHALHTWDIAVVKDPAAVVLPAAAEFVIDRLEMMARFGGKPTGAVHAVTVTTHEPQRHFSLDLKADGVSLSPTAASAQPDLTIAAEAFARLIYGRLDPAHTPAVAGTADLDELRRAFPGR